MHPPVEKCVRVRPSVDALRTSYPLFHYALGFIWVGVDQRKQGWHDKLAGTVVIRNTGKESVQFEDSI